MADLVDSQAQGLRVRLDKWIWAARFYKSRSLAATAIEAGHVRVNEERAKPACPLKTGDRVSIRKDGLAWTIEVVRLSDRRGGAADAALLFREDAQSAALRRDEIERRHAANIGPAPFGERPTKRDRRRLAKAFGRRQLR